MHLTSPDLISQDFILYLKISVNCCRFIYSRKYWASSRLQNNQWKIDHTQLVRSPLLLESKVKYPLRCSMLELSVPRVKWLQLVFCRCLLSFEGLRIKDQIELDLKYTYFPKYHFENEYSPVGMNFEVYVDLIPSFRLKTSKLDFTFCSSFWTQASSEYYLDLRWNTKLSNFRLIFPKVLENQILLLWYRRLRALKQDQSEPYLELLLLLFEILSFVRGLKADAWNDMLRLRASTLLEESLVHFQIHDQHKFYIQNWLSHLWTRNLDL